MRVMIARLLLIAAIATLPLPAAAEPWQLRTDISEIDDSINVFISTEADEVIAGRYGDPVRPTLTIRCKQNETDVLINWGMFITTDEADVLSRLDKTPARTRSWQMSTNYEATFAPSPIKFINEMTKHDRLLVQVTPHGENAVTTSFTISGLEQHLPKLRDACHW